jgi:anti-sigma B factor antagonist
VNPQSRRRDDREEVSDIDLHIESSTEGEWTVLAIVGELDLYTGPQLRDAVLAATGDGRDHIAIDLNGVTFIDSTGLGILVACLKRVRERDGALALIAPDTSPLIRLLSLTGLQEILPTHPTLAAAIA